MNAWKIVCATLLIFITGIITGASLVRFGERGPKPWQRTTLTTTNNPPPLTAGNSNSSGLPKESRAANVPAASSPLLKREFVQVLSRQLHLTAEQRERIDQIMAEGQERMRELRASLEPQTRRQILETREQIHALLTPAQRELFEQLMKQRSGRRNDGNGPPPHERRAKEPSKPQPAHETPPEAEPGDAPSPRHPAPSNP